MIYTLWFGYIWPSLKGNGPEALVQTIVYAGVAVAIYPPLRDWAKREAEKFHATEKADREHLHAKLDHIIKHHPDIPEFPQDK
jgi:hypothetical protein